MNLIKTLLDRLLGKKPADTRPHTVLGSGFYLTKTDEYNGMGGYSPVNVCLHREDDPTFCRCIVDGNGKIRNFPGITAGDWKKGLEFPADRRVRFSFRIGAFQGDRARVSWTLQPDGRYFEDEDGFGAEHCEEIVLYSYIDRDGQFLQPFTKED